MSNITIEYYNKNAMNFASNTINVEFKERQDALLKYLPEKSHILDFGCGSGRDSKAFIEKGYKVTAVDGSSELCKIASKYIGQEVICKKFQDLVEENTFDAVWACSSILHVPSNELPQVLSTIHKSLKSYGYFYTSFKYGTFEGIRNGRHFTDMTEESFRALIEPFADFEIIELDITTDLRPGREDEKWLNVVLRKG